MTKQKTTKTDAEAVKPKVFEFKELKLMLTVNAMSAYRDMQDPFSCLEEGRDKECAEVSHGYEELDIANFVLAHADEFVEIFKKKSVVVYPLKVVALMPASLDEKMVNAEKVANFVDAAFSRTEYKTKFIIEDSKCLASVYKESVTYEYKNNVLIAKGEVVCKDIMPTNGYELFTNITPSEVYAEVSKRQGIRFDCIREKNAWHPEWSGFPDVKFLKYYDVARKVKDIKITAKNGRIVFKATKIDPEDFLKAAAFSIFPEKDSKDKPITIGDLFSLYFTLKKVKLPKGIDFETIERSGEYRDIESWTNGLVACSFDKPFHEEVFEEFMKSQLEDLEILKATFELMLKHYKDGKKASKTFLDYCRESFKQDILANPMLYANGRYHSEYRDEIKDAAKCILGTVNEKDDEDSLIDEDEDD